MSMDQITGFVSWMQEHGSDAEDALRTLGAEQLARQARELGYHVSALDLEAWIANNRLKP